jgi:hypothetical protein
MSGTETNTPREYIPKAEPKPAMIWSNKAQVDSLLAAPPLVCRRDGEVDPVALILQCFADPG